MLGDVLPPPTYTVETRVPQIGMPNATTGMIPLSCDDLARLGMPRADCPTTGSSWLEPVLIVAGLFALFIVFKGR